MSRATNMTGPIFFCIFPAETICRILRYSTPRDIVRWRAVSRWFNAITYDASIWKDLYASSYLPRPPGPFPFQDSVYLEQALVRTEMLAHSWTTMPLMDVSHVELRAEETRPIKLLGGRWVVACESNMLFALHDVDASGEQRALRGQVIWDQEQKLMGWDVALNKTNDGQFVLYVLSSSEHQWDTGIAAWKLLEFHLDSESGMTSAVTVFDVPPPMEDEFDMCLGSGNSPFLYIRGVELVFDTRSRVFYTFPRFCIALEKTRCAIDYSDSDFSMLGFAILTNTHVVAFRRFSHPKTLIQVFTIDESSVKDGKGVLCLTHEGFLNKYYDHVTLLRNSTVDLVTGATNVRLFGQDFYERSYGVLDLILPEPSGEDVLPITISVDEKFTPKLREYDFKRSPYFDCSDAGYLRGLYIEPHTPDGEDVDNFSTLKFVIDATQDEYTLVCGEFSPLEWNHIKFKTRSLRGEVSFDGARGRLCFRKSMVSDRLVVVDIE